jgi:two-component system response regulator PhoP
MGLSRGRLLLIEEDAELTAVLQMKLSRAGFGVMVADSVARGLVVAREESPVVVVVNVDLPHGEDVVTRLKDTGVFLVVLTQAGTRVRSARPGVHVILKPFLMHTLLQCLALFDVVESLEVGAVRLNAQARTVTVSGAQVQVSPKEFELLRVLMRESHRAFRARELTLALWPERETHPNTLAVLVVALRRKLAKAGQGTFIRTVRGYGYALDTHAGPP